MRKIKLFYGNETQFQLTKKVDFSHLFRLLGRNKIVALCLHLMRC